MALRFCDSFDHYALADILSKWTAIPDAGSNDTSAIGTGRNSTSGLNLKTTSTSTATRRISKVVPNVSGTTCIVGMAVKVINSFNTFNTSTTEHSSSSTSGSATLLSIRYQGTTQVWFKFTSTGLILVYRGTTLLGTSSTGVTQNAFSYIEFKVVIHGSTGTVDVRIDGESVMALTGQNTAGATTLAWDEICIGCFASPAGTDNAELMFDDLVVMDGSGSYNNAFMGDLQVRVLLPNAVGNSSDSTASGGAVDRYTMVDEASMNSDTDYNTFAAVNDKDTYNYAACPVSGATVAAVVATATMRKADAGASVAVAVARISGTDYDGATSLYPASSYVTKQQIWERSAVDGTTVWTTSVIDAAEFGLKKTA
jgi:hypothetical protein